MRTAFLSIFIMVLRSRILVHSWASRAITVARSLPSRRLGTITRCTKPDLDNFYITTPIYYVNDKPHLGHAYTSVACDTVARFQRLRGKTVKFLSGTDEHGQKVEASARRRHRTPLAFADGISEEFRKMLSTLNCSNDDFIRTTEPRHIAAVEALWQQLAAKGYIYKDLYQGWYSVRDEAFYLESELIDGKAPSGSEVQWVPKEESYFFRLSAFEERLIAWYEANPDVIMPVSRRNEVMSFVRGGLKDISISRTTFKWGIPVPNDPKHVIYVWLDALTNYIAALGYPNTEARDFQTFWPANVHMVGKDILRFHAVYWPAFLMAAELPLPKRIFAHGWWTVNGVKMSKSIGNVRCPTALSKKYGSEQLRYFLLSEISLGADGDFSEEALVLRANTFLANEFGNLVQRTLSFAFNYCNGAIPAPHQLLESDLELLRRSHRALQESIIHVDCQAMQRYCETLFEVVRACNKYMDDEAPWHLRTSNTERMATAVYVLLETIRRLAVLFQPIIPASSEMILDMLSVPPELRMFSSITEGFEQAQALTPGTAVSKPVPVFPRIEFERKSK